MKNSKKIAAAAAVIVGFGLYSWHAKKEEAESQLATTSTATKTIANTASATTANTTTTMTKYKDGTYTGSITDAYYGNIQVKVTISNGKMTNVDFLQYPNDHHESVQINQRAMPVLAQEAIQSQTAQVDGVSGATDTSLAFIASMNAALNQAR